MLIYFDLCALQRQHDDQAQERVRDETVAVEQALNHCTSGGADLASSDALEAENEQNPYPDSRRTTAALLSLATAHQPVTRAVEQRADVLTAEGLRPADALHLASAEALGADYFCTCDDKLLRRGRLLAAAPLRVVSPVELVRELGR